MFTRRPHSGSPVRLSLDGESIEAVAGDSVAAAMLAAGAATFRDTPVGGLPRGPHCQIGNCYDCLVEIDGRPNRQACLVTVAPGMRVRRQRGAVRVLP